MHGIDMHEVSKEFAFCWQAAGRHLGNQTQDAPLSWLKADLNPPFLEHLSFRIGNQLFFVRIEDVENQLTIPGSRNGLISIADGCKGAACLMQMRKSGDGWLPYNTGWGLIDFRTGLPLNPVDLVTDKKIEMTDWELHDFAVQIVRDYVDNKLGKKMMSFQGNPGVDPSIWFIGDSGPEYIVVRAARYPDQKAEVPTNIREIESRCKQMSNTGYFASVALAAADSNFDTETPQPLWRGYGMFVNFEGIQGLASIDLCKS